MNSTSSTEDARRLESESTGAQDEQRVTLYDFLYRDAGRIASYYAQLFKGRLHQVEETDSERSEKDQTAKLNLPIIGGNVKSLDEIQTSVKRTVDPHDVVTTDLLSALLGENRVSSNVSSAPHGALVMVQGTLLFVDRYMLEMATAAFDAVGSGRKRKTREEKIQAQGFRLMKSWFSKLSPPSAFLLQGANDVQVVGTIKESGMEEPISTYYFKHGTAGLSDVFIIGIKEVPSHSLKLPDTQLLGASQASAQALSDMLFPPEAIRVTPLALFRKL